MTKGERGGTKKQVTGQLFVFVSWLIHSSHVAVRIKLLYQQAK